MTGPSESFVSITRNPKLAEVRPRETASQIAFRLRNRIAGVPVVMREGA